MLLVAGAVSIYNECRIRTDEPLLYGTARAIHY